MVGKRETGFTLVELMIVVLLMGILAAIAAPSYQGYMARSRLNGAARQVLSDLMWARMKAVKTNQRVKVVFYSNQYKLWNDADRNATVDDNEGDNVLKSFVPHYLDVSITNKTGDPIFLPKGTATGLATITIRNSSGCRSIIVSAAGRVRITDTVSCT